MLVGVVVVLPMAGVCIFICIVLVQGKDGGLQPTHFYTYIMQVGYVPLVFPCTALSHGSYSFVVLR